MMSIASSPFDSSDPQSNASTSTAPASQSKMKFIPQGKSMDRALAFILDQECMNRWGEKIYDMFYPGSRERETPEDHRKNLCSIELCTAEYLAYETYCKFPSIPRFERNVLLIARRRGLEMLWLFILKDNSSEEALHAPLVPEDVEAAMDFIGVKQKGVKWFDVRARLNGTCSIVTTTLLPSMIGSASRSRRMKYATSLAWEDLLRKFTACVVCQTHDLLRHRPDLLIQS